MFWYVALIICGFALAAFVLARGRALSVVDGMAAELHSRPSYHGLYSALVVLLTGITILVVASVASDIWIGNQLRASLPADVKALPQIQQERIIEDARRINAGDIVSQNVAVEIADARQAVAQTFASLSSTRDWLVSIAGLLASLGMLALTYFQIKRRFRARNFAERIILGVLIFSALIAILTTIGIVLSLVGETLRFFSEIPILKFLFGTHWNPLAGVFEGTINENSVGAIPLFAGTLLITLIAMLVAVPIGLMSAIYLSDYASPRVRGFVKPLLEILAGIPTVVYGFFAAITVAPLIRGTGESIGLNVASESALAAGLVMGIMIIPFISSLSDDVINAVPQSLREGSFGLGATKAETITKVVLPAALPGIVSAVLLGISRAVGETMIVVMAAGQGANLTWNPLEAVTTVTVQIVALITGDTEAETAAGPAFALGFTLFCVTLIFNVIALRIVQKYRQKYD
ncbi:MAG: phosphate ABC transporter permease subunit PstC [Pseudomonadota bacterium]